MEVLVNGVYRTYPDAGQGKGQEALIEQLEKLHNFRVREYPSEAIVEEAAGRAKNILARDLSILEFEAKSLKGQVAIWESVGIESSEQLKDYSELRKRLNDVLDAIDSVKEVMVEIDEASGRYLMQCTDMALDKADKYFIKELMQAAKRYTANQLEIYNLMEEGEGMSNDKYNEVMRPKVDACVAAMKELPFKDAAQAQEVYNKCKEALIKLGEDARDLV